MPRMYCTAPDGTGGRHDTRAVKGAVPHPHTDTAAGLLLPVTVTPSRPSRTAADSIGSLSVFDAKPCAPCVHDGVLESRNKPPADGANKLKP